MLSRPNLPSKHSLAYEYNINVKFVMRLWNQKDEVEQCCLSMAAETRASTFRHSKGNFPQSKDKIFTWIDAMRQASIAVSPTLAIAKAKQIAAALSISEADFKALWQW